MVWLEMHECGSVRLTDELPPTVTASLLAVINRYFEGITIYRDDGVKLSIEPTPAPPERSLWNVVLANTIYNPVRVYAVRYRERGSYLLGEVKENILAAVATDDDILTQFLDASEIKSRLDRSESFEDIVDLVRAMSSEHDGA